MAADILDWPTPYGHTGVWPHEFTWEVDARQTTIDTAGGAYQSQEFANPLWYFDGEIHCTTLEQQHAIHALLLDLLDGNVVKVPVFNYPQRIGGLGAITFRDSASAGAKSVWLQGYSATPIPGAMFSVQHSNFGGRPMLYKIVRVLSYPGGGDAQVKIIPSLWQAVSPGGVLNDEGWGAGSDIVRDTMRLADSRATLSATETYEGTVRFQLISAAGSFL